MMKKSPVTLVSETGERHTFDSSTEAIKFLGIKSPSVITDMKKHPDKWSKDKNGVRWHAEGGKVEKAMQHTHKGKNTSIIAVCNFNSTDPKHPERSETFGTVKECADFFDARVAFIHEHLRYHRYIFKDGEWWALQRASNAATDRLLKAIEEDDGIINLDEAEEAW